MLRTCLKAAVRGLRPLPLSLLKGSLSHESKKSEGGVR